MAMVVAAATGWALPAAAGNKAKVEGVEKEKLEDLVDPEE
jgi:hypothetical protein